MFSTDEGGNVLPPVLTCVAATKENNPMARRAVPRPRHASGSAHAAADTMRASAKDQQEGVAGEHLAPEG